METDNTENKTELIQGFAAPLEKDVVVYRIVVSVLGLSTLFTIAAATYMASKGVQIPSGIIAMGSMAIGGLVGLLSPLGR